MNAVRLLIMMGLLIVGSLCRVLRAQKIETSPASRERILRVETALNHLTIIELSEPITMAAAGSPAFKIERRENKVFVQPLEEGQGTNLFIWTPTSRYSYELAPAGHVSAMHFAIDHQTPVTTQKAEAENGTAAEEQRQAVNTLIRSIPVRSEGTQPEGKRVMIAFKDVLKFSDRWLVRYEISNRSGESYAAQSPKVALVSQPSSSRSLRPLRFTQLSSKEVGRLRYKERTFIPAVPAEEEPKVVPPGQELIGVVEIEPPAEDRRPTILQFHFPADRQGPVTGTLVL
jgi:Conjugal transfer protein